MKWNGMLTKHKVISVSKKMYNYVNKTRNCIWCYFHLILILPVKMVELPQQHANTTDQWLQTLPLPTVAKNSFLNRVEFLDPSLKTWPCTKTSLVLCENQVFFWLFWNDAFIESHCVFLCYFLQCDEVFLISLLDSCYHYLVYMDPVNVCSKSNILVEE